MEKSTIRTLTIADMIEITIGLTKAGVMFHVKKDSMTWVITFTGGY